MQYIIAILENTVFLSGESMKKKISESWIGIEEAANYLDIKVVTLRNWLKQGNGIPANRIGKLWKFKRSELDIWVKSGKAGKIKADKCEEGNV